MRGPLYVASRRWYIATRVITFLLLLGGFSAIGPISNVAVAAVSPIFQGPQKVDIKTELVGRIDQKISQFSAIAQNGKSSLKKLDEVSKKLDQFRVSERFPSQEYFSVLKLQLEESAGFEALETIEILPLARSRQKIDQKFLEQGLSAADLEIATPIYIEIKVKGTRANVKEWIRSWPGRMLRWIEPIGEIKKLPDELEQPHFLIKARAFKLREDGIPSILAEDPVAMTPRELWSDPVVRKKLIEGRTQLNRAYDFWVAHHLLRVQEAKLSFYLSRLGAK